MKLSTVDIQTKEVTQWQGLHLLHYSMSSCSQKVRILMGELGIDFTSHHVDLRSNEQKSDWFTGINPNGVVPVLVHDGEVHIESNDIIGYLNNTFAQDASALMPKTAAEQEKMQALLSLEDEMHNDLRTVTFTYLAPAIHGPLAPDPEFSYIGRFHAALDQLSKILGDQLFLMGDHLSLADISWFITLHRLALARYPLAAHRLVPYYERLAARPAFAEQVISGPIPLRAASAIYRTINRAFLKSLPRDYVAWSNQQRTA